MAHPVGRSTLQALGSGWADPVVRFTHADRLFAFSAIYSGMPFPKLAAALKAIAQFPGWSEPEPETGYCWFNAPLMIAGVIEHGFVLHGGFIKHVPDANVSFELRALKPGAKRTVAIARIDWRAVRGGHTNPKRPGSPVSGIRVSDSHHHSFTLNWLEHETRLRSGNLPMAEDIDQQIQTFESLRATVGILFRINNIDIVQPPKWEYDLFSNG